ncbi:MAG: hypothetical protein PHP44_09910 [Kiritimatiellae bacterium]|nr:hypothetical protein [Kiritimatiellia bacterium]
MGFAVGGLPGSADRLIGSIHSSLCLEENTECSRNIRENPENDQFSTCLPFFDLEAAAGPFGEEQKRDN